MAADLQILNDAANKRKVRFVIGKSVVSGGPRHSSVRRENVENVQAFDGRGDEGCVELLVILLILTAGNVRIAGLKMDVMIPTKILDPGVPIPSNRGQNSGRLRFDGFGNRSSEQAAECVAIGVKMKDPLDRVSHERLLVGRTFARMLARMFALGFRCNYKRNTQNFACLQAPIAISTATCDNELIIPGVNVTRRDDEVQLLVNLLASQTKGQNRSSEGIYQLPVVARKSLGRGKVELQCKISVGPDRHCSNDSAPGSPLKTIGRLIYLSKVPGSSLSPR